MKTGLVCLLIALTLCGNAANAADQKDVFKGKLFAPNIILENRDELQLSKEQFTAIRKAVVEVQAGVAEYEWDMQEAYQALMLELDKSPVDESRVLELAGQALQAENQVKKKQVAMLVRLKNLLTAEQIAYLESAQPKQ
jgi:conjugal transfer/entry exclusion protein